MAWPLVPLASSASATALNVESTPFQPTEVQYRVNLRDAVAEISFVVIARSDVHVPHEDMTNRQVQFIVIDIKRLIINPRILKANINQTVNDGVAHSKI